MPQWPHWYIVRGEGNRCADFDRFARLIRKYGDDDAWGRETRAYCRIANFKYWVLGEIINRAAPLRSAEVRRRGERWLIAHGMRVGPYGKAVPIANKRNVEESTMEKRPYGDLRDIIERRGGSMQYEREGYRHGAWIISLAGKRAVIEASGNRSFPELDRLYQTSKPNPREWDDYDGPLLPDAEEKLLSLLR